MIIDSFIFFNELKLLELRLAELYDHVDFFILVESKKTFSNKDKKLYYSDNKSIFEKYNKKIITVVLDELDGVNEWDREIYQRNSIQIGLDKIQLCETDILIISDCDEIPNTELLTQINGKMLDDVYSLLQETYYYDLESKKNYSINASKILTYGKFKELGGAHNSRKYETKKSFENAGWHFSYFGGLDNIILKIDSFSHQEFNNEIYTNKEKLLYNINNKKDLFFRPDEEIIHIPISENEKLPKNYKILL
jgi:beta-1,4-mannosyl-glycoprotein beta-1,4-N-acetylglucosaminyltransferase